MHPPILGVRARAAARAGLAGTLLAIVGAASAAAPDPACPAGATSVVERFVGATCAGCWRADAGLPGAEAPPAGGWALDWVVPPPDDAASAAAPLANGALPEAADRLARIDPRLSARLSAEPAAFDTLTPLAPPPPGRRLWAHSSLPHEGYLGVQMFAAGAWPAGARGWLALVEVVPPMAGDGTPSGAEATDVTTTERHLVRTLVGPLALPAAPGARHAVAPLFAMRWPEAARPERLVATAWVEGRDGRLLQLASERCPDPR